MPSLRNAHKAGKTRKTRTGNTFMSDYIDSAQDRELLDRDLALQLRKPELRHTGYCHNCGESTAGAFCDIECGNDYEQRKRFNG
jgi:hypothetical protein